MSRGGRHLGLLLLLWSGGQVFPATDCNTRYLALYHVNAVIRAQELPQGQTFSFVSHSGNVYTGIYKGLAFDSRSRPVVRIEDPATGIQSTLLIERLNMAQAFQPGHLVTISIGGTPTRGRILGFTSDGKVRFLQAGQTTPQVLPRNQIDFSTLHVDTRLAAHATDSAEAVAIRDRVHFNRVPGAPRYPEDAAFREKSRRAMDLFNDWLSGRGDDSTLSLQAVLEKMHAIYSGASHPGGSYRLDDHPYLNTRGERTLGYARRYGLTPNPVGPVDLPGIPREMSPSFIGERGEIYAYPELSPTMRETYYRALETQLDRYARALGVIEGRRATPGYVGSAANRADVRAALDAVVDFGRVAAAFRQFRNGNWGLYGPIVTSMVSRLGYEIPHPGFLDVLFQGATGPSLKNWFPGALEAGGHFHLDRFDRLNDEVIPE